MVLTTEDPDAAFDRAVAAGATVVCPSEPSASGELATYSTPYATTGRSASL